jgi:hypothetical protein
MKWRSDSVTRINTYLGDGFDITLEKMEQGLWRWSVIIKTRQYVSTSTLNADSLKDARKKAIEKAIDTLNEHSYALQMDAFYLRDQAEYFEKFARQLEGEL